MKNEQEKEFGNAGESGITRRRLFLCAAIGTFVAITGLQIAYRKLRPKNPLGITDITIDGPFEKYGYFTPKDLGQKVTNKTTSDFKLLTLHIKQGKYENSVTILFTFTGKEDPDRKMKISFTVYDKEENVIGKTGCICGDPRVVARNENAKGNMFVVEPVAALSTRLDKEKDISHISRIEIFAVEIKDTK